MISLTCAQNQTNTQLVSLQNGIKQKINGEKLDQITEKLKKITKTDERKNPKPVQWSVKAVWTVRGSCGEKDFCRKVCFKLGVKEWWIMCLVRMKKMSWQVGLHEVSGWVSFNFTLLQQQAERQSPWKINIQYSEKIKKRYKQHIKSV